MAKRKIWGKVFDHDVHVSEKEVEALKKAYFAKYAKSDKLLTKIKDKIPTKIKVKCPRCGYKNENGKQCKNRTCKSIMCWIHGERKGIITSNGAFKYRVKKSNIPGANDGLFLSKFADPIKKGQMFPVYSGEIISYKKVDEKYPGNTLAPYVLCQKNKKKPCIDSIDPFTNLPGRYANDCSTGSNRNSKYLSTLGCNAEYATKMMKETIMGKTYDVIPIVANRDINPGEEILINYGSEYWQHMNKK